METRKEQEVSCCPVLTFEPWQNLHINILEMLEKCVENNLLSDRFRTGEVDWNKISLVKYYCE